MHGGIAVAGDGVEAFAQEGFVAAGREAQGAFFEPSGGPGEGVEEHAAVAVEAFVGGVVGVEAVADVFEEGVGGEGGLIHGFFFR